MRQAPRNPEKKSASQAYRKDTEDFAIVPSDLLIEILAHQRFHMLK